MQRAILLLSLAAFGSSASLRATDSLLPLLATEFGTSTGGAAIVITAFAVSYGLLQVAYGPLADRHGKFIVICAGTLASALGTIACALAPTLELLAVARFAAGATAGALIPLSMAWIGDVVPYAQRQPVLARFLLGQITGIAFGQFASGLMAEYLGWRATFVPLGLLYMVVGALLLAELRRNPAANARPADADTARRSLAGSVAHMFGLLGRKPVHQLLTIVTLEAMLLYGSLAFVPTYLQLRFSIGPAAAGAMAMLFPAGGALYALFARRFIRGLGERGLALGGGSAMGAGFAVLAVAPQAWMALPGILALGMGYYMMHNTLQTHATQVAPEARGYTLSLFAFVLFTAQSLGVWLASQAVDRVGAPAVFGVSAVGLALLGWRFSRHAQQH